MMAAASLELVRHLKALSRRAGARSRRFRMPRRRNPRRSRRERLRQEHAARHRRRRGDRRRRPHRDHGKAARQPPIRCWRADWAWRSFIRTIRWCASSRVAENLVLGAGDGWPKSLAGKRQWAAKQLAPYELGHLAGHAGRAIEPLPAAVSRNRQGIGGRTRRSCCSTSRLRASTSPASKS